MSDFQLSHTGLSDLELAYIAECTIRVPRSRVIYSNGAYYLDHARYNKRELICNLQIENLIALGYLRKNQYGGVAFTLKCDDIYPDMICSTKVESPNHPGKKVDVTRILYGLELP